jgi:hypothetical protein
LWFGGFVILQDYKQPKIYQPMGRSKKQQSTAAAPPGEASNKATTEIIPDEQPMVRNASKRRSIKGIQAGEIVTVRNKENGAVNRMAAEYAVKLVQRGEGTYEILK